MAEQVINQEVDFTISERSIRWLASALRLGNLKIAKHQRHAGVWTDEIMKKFIDSLKKGHPCPLVLIYQDDDGVHWLEDGLQRLTAIRKFMADDYGELDTGRKYSEWSEVDRQLFEHKKLPVLSYSNASPQTRVIIFDRFQNGSPLNPGERLNSLGDTILVTKTRQLLYVDKDDEGNEIVGEYFNRLENVLGDITRESKDTRYTQLLELVAVFHGMAHGFLGKGISKKYNDLRDSLHLEIDEQSVRQVIEAMLYIFEEARRRYPTSSKAKLGVYRRPGNFIGPIVYSLKMFPDDWDRLKNGWIDVIERFARTKTKDEMTNFLNDPEVGLLRGLSKARSWNNTRWQLIYENAFNIPHANPMVVDDEDESDDTE